MKQKRRVYSIFFLLTFFSAVAMARGSQSDSSEIRINKAYVKSFFLDSRDLVIAPYHWRAPQWLGFGVTAAGFGLCYWQDKSILKDVQQIQVPLAADASKYFFEPLGRGIISFPVVGAFALHGLLTKNPRSSRVGLLSVKSLALSAVTVTVLKYSFARHRPYQDSPSNPYLWEGPHKKFSYRSFPSGHTITIFSIAGMIATEYPDKPWIPVLAYSIAALSGLSRIYDNKHWASDVVVGAALGIGISRMVYFRNNWKIRVKQRKAFLRSLP